MLKRVLLERLQVCAEGGMFKIFYVNMLHLIAIKFGLYHTLSKTSFQESYQLCAQSIYLAMKAQQEILLENTQI